MIDDFRNPQDFGSLLLILVLREILTSTPMKAISASSCSGTKQRPLTKKDSASTGEIILRMASISMSATHPSKEMDKTAALAKTCHKEENVYL
jgi:hypothetical protein